MAFSIRSLSPVHIPYLKNAKLVKIEVIPFLQNIVYSYTKPLPFENEPYTLETFPLLENTRTHTFSILDTDLQLLQQNTHPFKLQSLNKILHQVEHTEEQLTQ